MQKGQLCLGSTAKSQLCWGYQANKSAMLMLHGKIVSYFRRAEKGRRRREEGDKEGGREGVRRDWRRRKAPRRRTVHVELRG